MICFVLLIQSCWREEFGVVVGADTGAFQWVGTILVCLFEWWEIILL